MEGRDEGAFRAGLTAWFLRFGFVMEVEPTVRVFERCEFCQTRPVWTGAEWVMVRNPAVAMSKDVLGLGVRTPREYLQWLHAVGVGGIALYGDMPIFGEMYKRFAKVGVASNVKSSLLYSDMGIARMKTRRAIQLLPSDECRYSFFQAFGITVCQQLELEAMFIAFVIGEETAGPYGPSLISLTDCLGKATSK